MFLKRFLLVASAVAMLLCSGCSTYRTTPYSASIDNAEALQLLSAKPIGVGVFSATTPTNQIQCMAVGPMTTQNEGQFSEYIRTAFISDLRLAKLYSPSATLLLTGNVDSMDFHAAGSTGEWNIVVSITSSNGKKLSVVERYHFPSNGFFLGEAACTDTAAAFLPAVQSLIGKVVNSREFPALISRE